MAALLLNPESLNYTRTTPNFPLKIAPQTLTTKSACGLACNSVHTADSAEEASKMKLRGGAVDYGRIYEQKTAALLAIRCSLNPVIEDFWMLSNLDDLGAFDDLVLLIKYNDGTKRVFLIQLKHQENRGLQATQLEDKEGGFRLQKYQDSYDKIKKKMLKNKIDFLRDVDINQISFILFTNAPLTGKDRCSSVTLEQKQAIGFLDASSIKDGVFHVFNKLDSKKPFEEEFLQQFSLYTSQASATALDKLIKNEFESHFKDVSNTVVITVTDYFSKWAIGKKGKIQKIFKKDLQMKLLESLLQPYIVNPIKTKERKANILELLNDTLTTFNIIPVLENSSLENVFASMKYTLETICDIQLDVEFSWNNKQLINCILKEKQQFVAHLTEKDLYLAGWQSRVIPLIITYSKPIQEILLQFADITKNLSFVLLQPDNIDEFPRATEKDGDLMARILDDTYISLQGKNQIKLTEFKQNISLLKEITADIYMILLNGTIQIGEINEVENYYVKRSLLRPYLSYRVLDSSNISKNRDNSQNQYGDLFLIIDFKGEVPFKYSKHAVDIMTFLSKKCPEEQYIITTDVYDEELLGNLINIIIDSLKKAVHVVKMKDGALEWIYSRGSIETLQDFVIESTNIKNPIHRYIHEDQLLNRFQSTTNIICNNAGMGKTLMLKSLANKFAPNVWVSYVNLSENMPKITKIKNPHERAKFVMECQMGKNPMKILDSLCWEVYTHCWNQRNMVWLLDGYDEIPSEETLKFLEQTRELLKVTTWITTRPTYRRELELSMKTLSSEIVNFKDDDHVTFLWRYFETFQDLYAYTKDEVQYIINAINKCSSNLDSTFITIPLQTRMFAEVFGDDINQISDKENLTIVDLYNKFVDIKLKEYKSYEATSLKKTLSKLALKLFFTDDQLDDLLDFEELAEEALTFQESYRKDSLVIGLNETGDAVFGHRTFAEFLAAYWLTKQIITRKGQYNKDWLPLVEKLFYVEMIPVRIFFDRILCQDLPLHLAVLNNDVNTIELLLSQEPKTEHDKLGRSPLHLAVSYGTYFDLYVSSQSVGSHSIIEGVNGEYKSRIPLVKTQLQVSKSTIELFMDKGFLNSIDGLFQYDAFDYAMKSCSLEAVQCLYKRFEKENLLFEPGFDFRIFLYLIVYDNLYHVLSRRKVYEFNEINPEGHQLRDMFIGSNLKHLKMKMNNYYLTEVAAYTGASEALYELLLTGELTVTDGFPVHKACFSGHDDTVALLFKMGANVTQQDVTGWSPLHQAGKKGRSDITYQFLHEDTLRDTVLKGFTCMTPMHYACQGGHVECVKRLSELGGNTFQEDAFGHTPLLYASMYGYLDIVEFLLKSISVEERRDRRIQRAINVAAAKGYSVRVLIECGLNPDNVDDDGNTPLILASQNGFSNVIHELVVHGRCDINLMKTNATISRIHQWAQLTNHIDFSIKLFPYCIGKKISAEGGMNALHYAVLNNKLNCVRALILLNADRFAVDTIGLGFSPLIWAAVAVQKNVSEHLSQTLIEDAQLALIWSCILGYEDSVKVLFKNIKNLGEVIETSRNKERIEKILEAEYGLDYKDFIRPFGEVKNLPLIMAALNGRVGVIQELFKMGKQDIDMALHFAAKQGHVEAVKLLIEEGANENVTNERRLKLLPIVWASMCGRTEVVRYLLSNKTKEYLQNKSIHVALNWAAVGGHYDCFKILLDFGLDVENRGW
ncbi:hypothetical protein NQ317_019009 [Molorchus minor]|uniref:Uncharacterized protein n=1 Tax=Molorchus minor TaxID=1323400 RepID=A0ABQ9JQT6_9CUCU|nr:hypothetical protein NQ317_019009 [Molorchus minor]